jgi:hypothetical protein
MWDLWWTKWQIRRFLPSTSDFAYFNIVSKGFRKQEGIQFAGTRLNTCDYENYFLTCVYSIPRRHIKKR